MRRLSEASVNMGYLLGFGHILSHCSRAERSSYGQALSLWASSRARLHIVLNSETFCSTRLRPKLWCKLAFMMICSNHENNHIILVTVIHDN